MTIGSTDRISRVQFLRLGVWFTLGLWLITLVLPLPFGQPGVWSQLRAAGLFTQQTAFAAVLGLLIGVAVTELITHWSPLRIVAEQLINLIAWDTFKTPDYVSIALMAALGEEPLFRGALQPLIGLVPSALLFGLLHATSVAHVILACVLGLVLGWLYQWSGSLWPPIAAHLTIDLVTGLLLTRSPSAVRGD